MINSIDSKDMPNSKHSVASPQRAAKKKKAMRQPSLAAPPLPIPVPGTEKKNTLKDWTISMFRRERAYTFGAMEQM